ANEAVLLTMPDDIRQMFPNGVVLRTFGRQHPVSRRLGMIGSKSLRIPSPATDRSKEGEGSPMPVVWRLPWGDSEWLGDAGDTDTCAANMIESAARLSLHSRRTAQILAFRSLEPGDA